MESLDSSYFKRIGTKVSKDIRYDSYSPKMNGMVLFSGRGIPIAHLAIAVTDTRSNTKSFIARRNTGETDFQGIISDDNMEFAYYLTNLTKLGMIKIDIMKNDAKVTCTDPEAALGGINKVNEIHPLQTVSVESDQADNLSFILRATRKQGVGIKVKDNEALDKNDARRVESAKYWISVVPKANNSELAELFIDCFWAITDVIVIQKPCYSTAIGRYSSRGLESASILKCMASIPEEESDEEIFYRNDECMEMTLSYSARAPIKQSVKSLSTTNRGCDTLNDNSTLVDNSLVANVVKGRKIETESHHTGYEYIYDMHSPKTTLGLSVVEGLTFAPVPQVSELLEVANTIINDFEQDRIEEYLKTLKTVYKSEDCVVCLEGGPDVIIFTCGHQCLHEHCNKGGVLCKCPLCRGTIVACLKV